MSSAPAQTVSAGPASPAAPLATAPASQAAAAEAYFAASMARQAASGTGKGAKPAAQKDGREVSRQPSPSRPPAGTGMEKAPAEPPHQQEAVTTQAGRRNPPVLARNRSATEQSEDRKPSDPIETTSAAPTAQQPPASARSDEAYKILLDKVPGMAAIAAGSDPALQLKSWSVVKAEEPEVWIDLIAIRAADKQEEHFIWKIRLDEQTVFPLSQNARRMTVK